MNGLCCDMLSIDTNFFLHLLHQGNDEDAKTINQDGHIDELLDRLQLDSIALIVDDRGHIAGEYQTYIHPLLTSEDETDVKRYILAYWMIHADQVLTPVDLKCELFKCIKNVIHEKKEQCDRIFVFVACYHGWPLVTNDKKHILWGPRGEPNTAKNNRYTRWKKETHKHRVKGADLLTSREAHSLLDRVEEHGEENA
jgi:hypothetical protein